MTKRARRRRWLAVLWGATWAASAGCAGGPEEQILLGRVPETQNAVIRAVSDGEVVSAAPIAGDRRFVLSLPPAARYRFEVVLPGGVIKHLLVPEGARWTGLEVRVCTPSPAMFDLGNLIPGHVPQEPPPSQCEDVFDPACSCGGPDQPACRASEPPACDPRDPGCTSATCLDSADRATCEDACVTDPVQCGCPSTQPNCWPPPEPPRCAEGGGGCDPAAGLTPMYLPPDVGFGCGG